MSDGGKNKQKSKFINLDIEFLGFSEMTDPPDSLRTSLKMTLRKKIKYNITLFIFSKRFFESSGFKRIQAI